MITAKMVNEALLTAPPDLLWSERCKWIADALNAQVVAEVKLLGYISAYHSRAISNLRLDRTAMVKAWSHDVKTQRSTPRIAIYVKV